MLVQALFAILPSVLIDAGDISVQIHSLDSKDAFVASWRNLTSDALTIEVDGSEKNLDLRSLKSVSFLHSTPSQGSGLELPTEANANDPALIPAAEVSKAEKQNLTVFLRDGSRIRIRSVVSDGKSIRLMLDANTQVSIDSSHVRSIQLQALTSVQQTQWEAILDSRITADTLVLVRTAESLDKIEGIIGEIQAESVKFEFGGQSLDAPRPKLAGIVYFAAPATNSPITCVMTDVWGNTWNASQAIASLNSDRLELLLACGAKIDLPLTCVEQLDFSRGSQVYVADLAPIDQGWKAAIELDVPILGMDRMFGTQSVQFPKDDGPSLKIMGKAWVTYRVPGEYSKMVGSVALASTGGLSTPCRLQIKLEENLLYEQLLNDPSQLHQLSVAVIAGQRLKIEVLPESDFPVGDVVVCRELRLLK